jgi:hypothetical protein
VTVQGRLDEEAVLCTPEATYDMKFVRISNSMFLIAPGRSYSMLFHKFFSSWICPGWIRMGCTCVFTDWFFTDMSWLGMDAERVATQLNPTPPHFFF